VILGGVVASREKIFLSSTTGAKKNRNNIKALERATRHKKGVWRPPPMRLRHEHFAARSSMSGSIPRIICGADLLPFSAQFPSNRKLSFAKFGKAIDEGETQ
jgi:hypothetical protein